MLYTISKEKIEMEKFYLELISSMMLYNVTLKEKKKKYVPFVYQLLGIMILYFFSWNREYDQCLIQLNNVCVKQNNDPR